MLIGLGNSVVDDGLIRKSSDCSAKQTIDRLEGRLKENGLFTIRISHSDNAQKIEEPSKPVQLRPTELLIFGNPALGSQLMLSNQILGIDLPMKALAFEDENGDVWIAYNSLDYLRDRHGIDDKDELFAKMAETLNKLTDFARLCPVSVLEDEEPEHNRANQKVCRKSPRSTIRKK
ncbi:MAG: hypothetical protein COV44_05730 [Deltaproteobacteria bacterium CG11_big_fil_rev_8_21_14_0_20_45_16]|nr:MAG: hypothetical protein COV44_05730 [Deltaproteobacteria bacterium CG11_big_fil_rev_8_21_14_0_20_45_16]